MKIFFQKQTVVFKHNTIINRRFSTLIIPDINSEKGRVNSSFQILLKASESLNSPNSVLLYGEKIKEEMIQDVSYYVDNIYIAEHQKLKQPTAEYLSHIVLNLQKTHNFKNILTTSNNFGKNFLPRLAGMLKIEPISDVSKILGSNKFQRYIYAGNVLSTVESSQNTNILSIRLTSFNAKELKEKSSPKINKINCDEIDKIKSTKFVENILSSSDKPELGSAKVVISGGRALKSSENFKILDDLAKCFKGAAIGASRAAVDAGYVPNDLQVGQTGKTVAPDLYFAIGISGAIQHVAGMKDSKCIVAINTDGEAPIFNVNLII